MAGGKLPPGKLPPKREKIAPLGKLPPRKLPP